ncbi:protein AF1q [Xiphias gladius]|uniref:protein AF1q n=1 Tax=Xiphias gladius TaxID=8245 RepID=UPI001A99E0EF|nr:protein AF1q [Xiphias gladius]
MMKSSSQYDSFLFWRQPIPALDLSELEDLGLIDGQPANSSKGKDKLSKLRGQDEEAELLEFSSFNYWRAPIADVDALLADLNLLL